MRAIVISHLYLDPDRRGKLRALTGLGAAVAAAIPGGIAGEDHGVRLIPIRVRGDPSDPNSLTWSRKALRRLFADFRPDLVQIEQEPGTQAAAAAAREAVRLEIPVVLFARQGTRPGGLLARWRAARALRAARVAIGGNALAMELLREQLPGRVVVSIPQTGISLPPVVERTPHENLAIGYVGRLLPDRSVDTLLRACAMIMGSWSLTVAGTGPDQEALELLSQRLGLASRVCWLGGVSRSEIDALWPELDCLVLPARKNAEGAERWSNVLVEAMARGVVPVVMEGGIPEAIVGPAGIVTRDEESLGVALQTLRAYPEDRTRLSAAARQRVLDHFVDAALAQQTLDLWEQVLAGGRALGGRRDHELARQQRRR